MKFRVFKTILLACLMLGCQLGWSQASYNIKKNERYRRKADRYFEDFYYLKAIQFYEKALGVNTGDQVAMLGIARSYVKVNDLSNAELWYKKAIPDFQKAEKNDQLNYAKALASSGKYDEAQAVYGYLAEKENNIVASQIVHGLTDLRHFYIDSLKYSVRLSEVNSPEADFSPTFFEDGIVFASAREKKGMFKPVYNWDNSYFLDLYYARLDEDKLVGEPVLFPPTINTIYHEGPVAVYDNGNQMIFTKNNFGKNNATPIEDGVTKLELYYTFREGPGKKWEKPVPLVIASGDHSFGHPAVSPDGSVMYFVSDMPGGFGLTDIWKTEFKNGAWQAPVNLGEKVNTPASEMFPYFADSVTLYFASDGHEGLGGMDIFKAQLTDKETWEVKNMGYPINTSKDDFGLAIQGKRGYFSSNRDGGVGNDDIYWFNVHTLMIEPVLVDAATGEELQGEVKVFDKTQFREIDLKKENMIVYFESIGGYEYIFDASSPGYVSRRVELHTRDIPIDQEPYRYIIPLEKHLKEVDVLLVRNYGKPDQVFKIDQEPILFEGTLEMLKEELLRNEEQVRTVFEVSNVYHDFDQPEAQEESKRQLQQLAEIMLRFPLTKVVLSAFADSRGSRRYNEKLARKRVRATSKYLQELGVDKERIEETSFGEEILVSACPDGAECSEEEHQLNRRTEVTLLPLAGADEVELSGNMP